MNKYELALVVDAKIEEDVRVATVEKAKDYVTKFGGNITNVDEWGKKKLAYEIQHMKEGYYYFIQFDAAGGKQTLSEDIDKAALERGIPGRTVRDAKRELGDALKSKIVEGRKKVFWME